MPHPPSPAPGGWGPGSAAGGSSPSYEHERKDHTTRRLVSGFQSELREMSMEVASISNGLDALKEASVSHKALLAWAGGFAITVISCVWMLLGKAESSTKERIRSAEDSIEAVKVESKRDTAEVRRDVRDLYRAVLTRKRQERLEQPIAEDVP